MPNNWCARDFRTGNIACVDCQYTDEEEEDSDDEATLSKVLRSTGMGGPGQKCKPRSYVEVGARHPIEQSRPRPAPLLSSPTDCGCDNSI